MQVVPTVFTHAIAGATVASALAPRTTGMGRELSVAVRKLEAVALRDPVMPVADGFLG